MHTLAASCTRPCASSHTPATSLRRPAFVPAAQQRTRRAHRLTVQLGIKHTPCNTVVQALKVGDKMSEYPDYYRVLKTQDGKGIALSSFEGKSNVVLFFYPKAATPGCTKQACKFRDDYEKFQGLAEVLGISSDTPQVNAEFAKNQRLPFPLLSDAGELLRKNFDIKGDFLGLLPGRETFVIDKKGKVVLAFNNQFNPEQHVGEALQVLQSLQSSNGA